MNEEFIVYHGTTNEAATEILENNEIRDSTGTEEWLGKGKYFYDKYTNAIEYIMKKYIENRDIERKISYKNLINNYCIIETIIECNKDDILDLDDIIVFSDFVSTWERIYDKVKNDPEFIELKFRDGYIIDYMLHEVLDYKIVVRTFDRVLKNKKYRDGENKIFDSTRIVYEIKQKYICVKDNSCIKTLVKFDKDFQTDFNKISALKKIIDRSFHI